MLCCRGQGVRSDRPGGGPSCRGCHSALPPPHRRWAQVTSCISENITSLLWCEGCTAAWIWSYRAGGVRLESPSQAQTFTGESNKWLEKMESLRNFGTSFIGVLLWTSCLRYLRAEHNATARIKIQWGQNMSFCKQKYYVMCNSKYQIQSNYTSDPLGSKSRETVVKTLFFFSKWICCGYIPSKTKWLI